MASGGEDLEGRLVELETKSSFQESELRDMSAILVDQETRIGRLEATVRALREKVKELSGEGQLPLPSQERPPHY